MYQTRCFPIVLVTLCLQLSMLRLFLNLKIADFDKSCFRAKDELQGVPVSELIYIHSKLCIVDDNRDFYSFYSYQGCLFFKFDIGSELIHSKLFSMDRDRDVYSIYFYVFHLYIHSRLQNSPMTIGMFIPLFTCLKQTSIYGKCTSIQHSFNALFYSVEIYKDQDPHGK